MAEGAKARGRKTTNKKKKNAYINKHKLLDFLFCN
jgi:hypothetical protein